MLRSRTSASKRRNAGRLRRIDAGDGGRAPRWVPSMTFSMTLMARNRRRVWNVRATPRLAISSVRRPTIERPSTRISPPRGPIQAGDDIERRGLARAVRADQAADFAGIDPQREAVERPHAAEVDGDAVELQGRLSLRRRGHAGSPQIEILRAPGGRSWAVPVQRPSRLRSLRDHAGRLHRLPAIPIRPLVSAAFGSRPGPAPSCADGSTP